MLVIYRDLIPFLNVPFFVFEILFYICSRFLFSEYYYEESSQEWLLAATNNFHSSCKWSGTFFPHFFSIISLHFKWFSNRVKTVKDHAQLKNRWAAQVETWVGRGLYIIRNIVFHIVFSFIHANLYCGARRWNLEI